MAYTKKPRFLKKKRIVRRKKVYRKKGVSVKGVKAIVNSMMKKTCEKKEYNTYLTGQQVGQFQALSTGANPSSASFINSAIVSSSLTNGTTDITRVGDEIMVTGIHQMFQFSHQQNTSQAIRCKYYMFSPRVSSNTASFSTGAFLNPNPIVYSGNTGNPVLYDFISSRNIDNISNFKILRSGRFIVPADQASLSQKLVKTVSLGLKFKKPWRVRFDTSGTLVSGQIFVLIVAESGNTSANVPNLSQTSGIAITDTYSGLNLSCYTKVYYIDP